MYCESWIIKRAERQRIDAFELWCWRRLLRVPWTPRRSNHSILKEISPEYSLEGLMLKMKLIVWPPDTKNWLIGKDPDAGKDWKPKKEMTGWDDWMDHQFNGHEFEQAMIVGNGEGSLACCSPWGLKALNMSNWNELNWIIEPVHIVAKGWLQNECSSTSDWINYASYILFYMAVGWIAALRCIIIQFWTK